MTAFLAAHIGRRQDPYHLGLAHLGDWLSAHTGGRLAITILPQALGGSEVAILAALRSRDLDLAVCTSAPLVPLAPALNLLDLPFLFPSRAGAHAVFAGPGLAWGRGALRQAGLGLLAIFDGGERHLAVRPREVRHPSDLRGLRLRTLETPVHRAVLETWGAIPVHAPSGSVRKQLLAGELDGVERSWSNLRDLGLAEAAPHLTEVGHSVVPAFVVAGSQVRARVGQSEWRLLEQGAVVAAAREREAYVRADADALETLKASGIVPAKGDREAFRAAAARVWAAFRSRPGFAEGLRTIEVAAMPCG